MCIAKKLISLVSFEEKQTRGLLTRPDKLQSSLAEAVCHHRREHRETFRCCVRLHVMATTDTIQGSITSGFPAETPSLQSFQHP